jgi:hypothetical protein
MRHHEVINGMLGNLSEEEALLVYEALRAACGLYTENDGRLTSAEQDKVAQIVLRIRDLAGRYSTV